MKIIILATFLGLLTVFPVAAQVEISPMKVIYVRPQTDLPDYKKRFEIRYPLVEGVKNPRVRKRMESAISYWRVFDTTLKEDLDEYAWLESMDYRVEYNKHSILDILLWREGSAAYPNTLHRHVIVDTRTGRAVGIRSAFTNIGKLLVKIDEAQKKEIADHIKELKEHEPKDAQTFSEMMSENQDRADTLDEFKISDKGVTFIYDYGFPHVIQALAPDGEYFFTWKELTPFIRPRGSLRQFRVKGSNSALTTPEARDEHVTVTPKVTKYPRKGQDIPDDLKVIVIRTPVVSGIKDPGLLKKVQDAVNFEKVFGYKLTEEDFGSGPGALYGENYKLNYVDDSLLSVELTGDWLGLTESEVANVVVDLRSGDRLYVPDVFKDLDALAKRVSRAQAKEIEEKAKELKKEGPELPSILREQVAHINFSSQDLREFSLNSKGVVFLYKYDFSPPATELQPAGRYAFTWKELTAFIKPDGALAKFRVQD